MIKVVPVTASSNDWQVLIRDSHQTSLYVLPEWIAIHPVKLFVAKKGSSVVGGIVASRGITPLPMVPYQGMLLLRKEDREVAQALLSHVERLSHPVSVWNPPALVDIRPFTWRFWDAQQLWQHEIKYTFICDQSSSLEHRMVSHITGDPVGEVSDRAWFKEWADLPWVTVEDRTIIEVVESQQYIGKLAIVDLESLIYGKLTRKNIYVKYILELAVEPLADVEWSEQDGLHPLPRVTKGVDDGNARCCHGG